jgi:hypothetical protein
MLLSRRRDFWITHWIYWTHRLQFLFTISSVVLSPTFCSPSPVLWYRLPTAKVSFPRFKNYPRPTATATHSALSNFWNCLLLSRYAVCLEIVSMEKRLSSRCLATTASLFRHSAVTSDYISFTNSRLSTGLTLNGSRQDSLIHRRRRKLCNC